MNTNNEMFNGEYSYTMANYKIPMKRPCDNFMGAGNLIDIPPVPGTEDIVLQPNVSQPEPGYKETYASPLAAVDYTHTLPLSESVQETPKESSERPPSSTNRRPKVPATDGLPEELVKLFKPLCCDLCSTKINSPRSAQNHYESKNHEKKTNNWLVEWSRRTGEPIPNRPALDIGTMGSSSTYCEVCDVALTSIQHAKQHYLGRKHRNAVTGRSKPKGKGYYDANNKWVRTNMDEADPTNRFGIGESFLANTDEKCESTSITEQSEATGNTTPVDVPENVFDEPPPPPPPLPTLMTPPPSFYLPNYYLPVHSVQMANLIVTPDEIAVLKAMKEVAREPGKYCEICDISVNMESHMRLHLAGAKHAKRLRQLGEPPYEEPNAMISQCLDMTPIPKRPKTENVSGFDYSVFRTPSGQYYCNVCNLSVTSEVMLAQHMASKKHMKTMATPRRK